MNSKKGIRILLLLLVIMGVFLVMGCSQKEETKSYSPTIKTGVYGQVIIKTGDCTPKWGWSFRSKCEKEGLATGVYIREITKDEILVTPKLITEEHPIKETISNNNGFYEIELPPGNYSLFVNYGGAEYCNSWNSAFERCVVQVKEGQATYYKAEIN